MIGNEWGRERLQRPCPIVKWIILLGLLTCFQACQQHSIVDQSTLPPDTSPAGSTSSGTEPPPGFRATGAGPSGLTGRVTSASDVSGQPDKPLAGQMIIAVQAERAGVILAAGGKAPDDQALRFWSATLAQHDPAVTVTLSDAAGVYALALNPGEYILCVADSDKTPPDFPVTTHGCGRVQVPPGALRRVDISRGFGEILLIPA